jgi:hypothetical protein
VVSGRVVIGWILRGWSLNGHSAARIAMAASHCERHMTALEAASCNMPAAVGRCCRAETKCRWSVVVSMLQPAISRRSNDGGTRAQANVASRSTERTSRSISTPLRRCPNFSLTTLCASTPSGGRHLYCRYVEGIRNRVFDWGEVRSTGLTQWRRQPGREWFNTGDRRRS